MPTTTYQRSFAGGELAPSLAARADLPKYNTALRKCRNFIVQRYGGVTNRPGTRYVSTAKEAVGTFQKFMRYISETPGESLLIEVCDGVFRFYLNGEPVMDGGDPYEVAHPFGTGETMRWEQQGTVITLTSQTVQPHELIYSAADDWELNALETKPELDAPENLNGTGSGGTDNWPWAYKVTAAHRETYEESEPSDAWTVYREVGPRRNEPFSLIFDDFQDAVKDNAAEYYIYLDPFRNGIYGFLATAVWDGQGSFHFHDLGFPPDFSQTPPIPVRKFEASGDYPAMCAYFQQRRFFANTINDPESLWGSRVAFPRNFGISSPLQDDDAVEFRVVARQRHPVQHLVALERLVMLTDVGEWLFSGDEAGILLPTAIHADQVGYYGASPVVPCVIGNSILYVQARGRLVRDLVLDPSGAAVQFARDLTLHAGHLFKGYQIVKLDYQQTPHSVLWAVRDDGILLGLTYIPEEDVYGWHRHSTGEGPDLITDVCVVPEEDEDAVYLMVERTIDGSQVRYIERMASREFTALEDAFFVDCGITRDGSASSSVTGLDHLEGEVVAVLADGVVLNDGDPDGANAATYTVTGGAITLPTAASKVQVGLRIPNAEIETLSLDVAGANVRDKRKAINGMTVLIEESAQSFQAGPDSSHLKTVAVPTWKAAEAVDGLADGLLAQALTAAWRDDARVLIRQNQPLPLTILGVMPQVNLGG